MIVMQSTLGCRAAIYVQERFGGKRGDDRRWRYGGQRPPIIRRKENYLGIRPCPPFVISEILVRFCCRIEEKTCKCLPVCGPYAVRDFVLMLVTRSPAGAGFWSGRFTVLFEVLWGIYWQSRLLLSALWPERE